MWPRAAELLLAAWLAASPWLLPVPAEDANFLRVNSLACAALIALAAMLSFRTTWGKAHLASLALALWLIAVAFRQPDPPPAAAYQNYVITGLTLLLFAVLPSRAGEPPSGWREHFQK